MAIIAIDTKLKTHKNLSFYILKVTSPKWVSVLFTKAGWIWPVGHSLLTWYTDKLVGIAIVFPVFLETKNNTHRLETQ